MNLALFDFDGTVTHADTFKPFLQFASSPRRWVLGTLLLAPMIVGYKIGLVPTPRMRAAAAMTCFRGRKEPEVQAQGRRYAETLSALIRDEARERLQWHERNGDRIVIVSASLNAYLEPWCAARGFELVCTELASVDGVLTGRYQGGDCTGKEKARRVRARYDLASYRVVYAYGDTDEDRPLLELAHKPYFRWRELTGDAA
ncbi:MAG TPA: HAD family hydrolase [Polyangiaceae bacterium]